MHRAIDHLANDLRLPALRPLVRHWLALLHTRGSIPMLSDLDPLQFAASMRHTWIIDVDADGSFRFRLSGETLIEWYGFNLKGKRYEEVFPAVTLPGVVQSTRRVLGEPAAVYQAMTARMPDWSEPAALERIGLPLCAANGRIAHMLGATVFERHVYNGKGSIDTAINTEYWYGLPGVAADTASP